MKRLVSLCAVIVLALSYLIAAKLGLKLAYVNEYTTAVWPPTGIALAALLLWGYRLWPGILIGAFLANVTVGGAVDRAAILASLGIAIGNTLEALVGAYLVNRFAGGRKVFQRAQDVFRFALVGALVSTAISASMGVASLCIAHLARRVDAPAIWLTWWIGDAGGDLVFAPTMILCGTDWRLRWSLTRSVEAGLLIFTSIVLSLAAFTSSPINHSSHLNLAFLCVPAMLWAAFRFEQRETAVTILLVSGIAVWSWVHGVAAGEPSRTHELLELQAYFCLTSLTLMAAAAEVSNRRQNELSLKRLAAIVESSDDAMFAEDRDGMIVSWNAAAEEVYGYVSSEAIGQPSSILLLPRDQKDETKLRRKDGTIIDIALTRSPIRSSTGALTGVSVVARDITDRKRMEEQFRQAQKLESIGLLAGGVAHDFNNLLVGILGNASLALDQLPASHPTRHLLEDVVLSSQRAAAVVSQLLTYAGRGECIAEPVCLGEVAHEAARLVQSSIPKEVTLRIELADDLPVVSGDASQIQQILMNLIINAAEAIGEKPGAILVTLKASDISQSYMEGDRRIRAGRYAALRVQDSGSGMDEKTKARIFEPFFTTKFTGRGLGMAVVLGIVRRHKGAMNVVSAPGQGATFEVLLPAVEGAPMVNAAAQSFGAGNYLM